jgi:prepilin-type N-terminal cleavage/methylation domain-containing protein
MQKRGFSLVEVLIALIFMSLAFLPIYNLFRFGSQGTTNNIYEVTANNYASDLINFVRDLKTYHITAAMGNGDKVELKNDEDIKTFFLKIALVPPPATLHPYVRSLKLEKHKGRDTFSATSVLPWLRDLLDKRRSVPNYMVKVRVEFPRSSGNTGLDDVTLFSLVMD